MAYQNAQRRQRKMRPNPRNAAQATHVQPVTPGGTTGRPKPTSQFNPGPQQCTPCMTQGPGRQGTGRRGHGCQGPGGEGGSNWGDDV